MAKTIASITPPKVQLATFRVIGTAPYLQCSFSQKAREVLRSTMEAGSTAKKNKKKEPRDFKADFEGAKHVSEEGWLGIPAPAFRNAMIRACKAAGFVMKDAKTSLFVVADGLDRTGIPPLVKIDGEPEEFLAPVRNARGIDLRMRPLWRNWSTNVTIEFDADVFTLADVANVLSRAGRFVGIGEGRADSKESNGCGFGFFKLEESE